MVLDIVEGQGRGGDPKWPKFITGKNIEKIRGLKNGQYSMWGKTGHLYKMPNLGLWECGRGCTGTTAEFYLPPYLRRSSAGSSVPPMIGAVDISTPRDVREGLINSSERESEVKKRSSSRSGHPVTSRGESGHGRHARGVPAACSGDAEEERFFGRRTRFIKVQWAWKLFMLLPRMILFRTLRGKVPRKQLEEQCQAFAHGRLGALGETEHAGRCKVQQTYADGGADSGETM